MRKSDGGSKAAGVGRASLRGLAEQSLPPCWPTPGAGQGALIKILSLFFDLLEPLIQLRQRWLALERPYTGSENFQILLECRSYMDWSSCRKDVFWRAILNTRKFRVLQVTLM